MRYVIEGQHFDSLICVNPAAHRCGKIGGFLKRVGVDGL